MDQIFVNNLLYSGRHGHLRSEQDQPQTFRIDVSCKIDSSKVSKSDDISDTLDYRKIRTTVKNVIEGPPIKMIEALAQKIADQVLALPLAEQAIVTIYKEQIWKNGTPGVRITRHKKLKKKGP